MKPALDPLSIPDIELHQHLGAIPHNDGSTTFCVWAPLCDEIVVDLINQNRSKRMTQTAGGYHVAMDDRCGAGDRYMYRIDGGPPRSDPASRFQPNGVHEPSEVIDRNFDWTDQDWSGVAQDDLVVYELHIGAFTQQGTFASAIERLDELVELGVTAIELMPVSAFAGRWNWGYDGVNWFAPSGNYGTPDDFRRLVNAAHAKGLAVFLDVVYNHLGPEGNYLAEFGPYLSERHQTPWGAAPNFDGPTHGAQVRRFVIANVLHWFDEYHVDGLRVDAIHCMRDDSEPHIAADISRAVQQWSERTRRPAMLIAESNVYDPEMITPLGEGGIGFDAQWCDDFLHSVFTQVRPGERLCHRSYKNSDLEQVLDFGYVFQGSLREQDRRRDPTARVDTHALVYSIQHHDFIGNHPLGKRLHQITSRATQRAAAALLLLSPAIPMMFMGEEFCCDQPFQFFVDFGDQHLRDAVVAGRKREYPQHDWSGGVLPTTPEAFSASKIGSIADGDLDMRDWYLSLIKLRKAWRGSGLLSDQNVSVHTDQDLGLFTLNFQTKKEAATVAVRLSESQKSSDMIEISHSGLLLDSLSSQLEEATPGKLAPNHAQVFHQFLD